MTIWKLEDTYCDKCGKQMLWDDIENVAYCECQYRIGRKLVGW